MGRNIIVIGGPAGSGKTTYATYIADKLNYRYVSAGSIFREIAKELETNIIDLNRRAESDLWIDYYIDKKSLEEALKGKVVIEGHLAPWILSQLADLRIYFTAPLKVRVMRIAEREKRAWQEVLVETAKREFSHALRFKKIYGIDITDLSIFDYVIDTSRLNIDEVKKIIDTILDFSIRNGVLSA